MPEVQKYVHDENIRKFKEKLREETDPTEIKRIEALIQKEDELYAAATRLDRTRGSDKHSAD